MKIIPAFDILGGKAVRFFQGDYDSARDYKRNPVEIIKETIDTGFDAIHIIDLNGARTGRPHILKLVTQNELPMAVQVGGGIRDLDTARAYIACLL